MNERAGLEQVEVRGLLPLGSEDPPNSATPLREGMQEAQAG
jgi:hypothetical protein